MLQNPELVLEQVNSLVVVFNFLFQGHFVVDGTLIVDNCAKLSYSRWLERLT